MDYLFKPIVLVTGFGPFVNHPVNASWEAVKLMNKVEIERKHNVEFVPIEISVTYENVDQFVPALWETHTPKLMLHVGVSSIAKEITIETQAHKKGYERLDYCNKYPENKVSPANGALRIKTKLDVEQICKEFNNKCPCETKAGVSYDAGRYVCEYIYYTSLTIDSTRTIFVHVPDLTHYPSMVTAKALEQILDLCMQQINEIDATENDKFTNLSGAETDGLDKEQNGLDDTDGLNDDIGPEKYP